MHWIARVYASSLVKKYLMAATGVVLFLFVVVHMLGNLQIYLGAQRLNHYAALLRAAPALVWATRAILAFAVGVHIVAAAQLFLANRRGRPVKYARRTWVAADYAARTMVWSGPIIALFIGYHLLHLTVGAAHPSFDPEDVYRNVVVAFSSPPVAAVYVLANLLLGYHLFHGLWSLFQSFGISHPAYDGARKAIAAVAAVVIAAGNVSIPVAVLAGLVR